MVEMLTGLATPGRVQSRGGELVDIDQRLVGHGRQVVEGHRLLRILVECREIDPVVGKLRCRSDVRRSFDNIPDGRRTVQRRNGRIRDRHGQQIGSIEGQRTCLVFALAQQLLQMERHGIRSGLAGRDGYPLVGKRIVFRIEHRPRGVVTGVVGIDERWIDCNGDRDVATGRISQRCGECPIEFIERVFDRCRLHVSRFRHVEVDHITELVVVGIIGLTGAESGRSDQP